MLSALMDQWTRLYDVGNKVTAIEKFRAWFIGELKVYQDSYSQEIK